MLWNQTILPVFASMASLCIGNSASATGFTIDDEDLTFESFTAMQSTYGEGVVWRHSTDHEAQGDITYTAPSGKNTDQIGLSIRYGDGRPITQYPIPLGHGLALCITGRGELTFRGQTLTWDYQLKPFPVSPTSRLPGAEDATAVVIGTDYLHLPEPISEGTFSFKSDSFFAWLVCTTTPCAINGTTVEIPLLQFSVVGGLKGEIVEESSSNLDITKQGSPTMSSTCQITVDPAQIEFGTFRSTGVKGMIKWEESNIAITCSNNSKYENVTLQIDVPELYSSGNNCIAAFQHSDGSTFKGLGLIHAYDQKSLVCDGSTSESWNTRRAFEGKLSGTEFHQPVYWGLCRMDDKTDIGDFYTTAIVRFWVN